MSQDVKESSKNQIQNSKRYLRFALGAENYAVSLLSVKEVIAKPELTPIPFTPSHFLGILNLRGQIISVIDLRIKLGIKPDAKSETAVVICDFSSFCLGVVVDSIHSVLVLNESEMTEKPDIENAKSTDYILGVYRIDDELVVLIDIFKTLNLEDHRALNKTNKSK